jgi:hypothetical protein
MSKIDSHIPHLLCEGTHLLDEGITLHCGRNNTFSGKENTFEMKEYTFCEKEYTSLQDGDINNYNNKYIMIDTTNRYINRYKINTSYLTKYSNWRFCDYFDFLKGTEL